MHCKEVRGRIMSRLEKVAQVDSQPMGVAEGACQSSYVVGLKE